MFMKSKIYTLWRFMTSTLKQYSSKVMGIRCALGWCSQKLSFKELCTIYCNTYFADVLLDWNFEKYIQNIDVAYYKSVDLKLHRYALQSSPDVYRIPVTDSKMQVVTYKTCWKSGKNGLVIPDNKYIVRTACCCYGTINNHSAIQNVLYDFTRTQAGFLEQ